MYSIYHFFAQLVRSKTAFGQVKKLEDFPFDETMLSCRSKGLFPDMALRLNAKDVPLSGGELIELKDSKGYSIASFNSTIPTGQKHIDKFLSKNIREQMEKAGDDIQSLPIRDVFYLVRGRRKKQSKIALIHGSFFETVPVDELIQEAFSQVLEDRIEQGSLTLSEDLKAAIVAVFSEQSSFSQVRDVENASVKLRFRIMTEAKSEGNILSSAKYPQIEDNTLNLVVPCHDEAGEVRHRQFLKAAYGESFSQTFEIFTIHHPFNGAFLVFSADIGS